MKVTFGLAIAAALAFACSSGSKNTRTAANDTGLTQQGSIEGTQGTAGGANGAQGTAAAGTSNTGNSGATASTQDGNTQGTIGGSASTSASSQSEGTQGQAPGSSASNPPTSGSYSGGDSSGSSASAQGSAGSQPSNSGTYGTSASSNERSGHSTYPGADRSGSASGSSGSMDRSGSVAVSSDNASLRTVTGSVAKVDENSITLDQASGGVTLTVDSQTQVIRSGKPSAGISSIREGEKVRASFDPASNRADKIEVMGRTSKKGHQDHKGMMDKSGSNDTMDHGNMDSTTPSGRTSTGTGSAPANPDRR
jgi:hypothetical protein